VCEGSCPAAWRAAVRRFLDVKRAGDKPFRSLVAMLMPAPPRDCTRCSSFQSVCESRSMTLRRDRQNRRPA
jgi:hypothetical protein